SAAGASALPCGPAPGGAPPPPFGSGGARGGRRGPPAGAGPPRAETGARLADPTLDEALTLEATLAAGLARQLIDYLAAARAALGTLPTQQTVVVERFFDEGGGMQLIVHAPFGARINRAWGLALRKSFCRTFNFELQPAATDDGIIISLGAQHSFPLELVSGFVPLQGLRDILVQAVLQAPLFETRWRWNVTRALAVLRQT